MVPGAITAFPRYGVAAGRRKDLGQVVFAIGEWGQKWVTRVKFLTWTDDNLLRQVVYEGLREDKPAAEIRRPVPHR
jgi:ATP-dependent DNA ligase